MPSYNVLQVFTDGTFSVFLPNGRGDILSHVDTSGIHDLFKQLLKTIGVFQQQIK